MFNKIGALKKKKKNANFALSKKSTYYKVYDTCDFHSLIIQHMPLFLMSVDLTSDINKHNF